MEQLDNIQNLIYVIRGQRVMLDFDLARLYQVETSQLKRQVRRNIERFEGEDFMFELTREELLRCQIGTLNKGRGQHFKYLPFAFTEIGVAMLSGVLNSQVAIQANRKIMRAFVAYRHLAELPIAATYLELKKEIEAVRNEVNDILADQNDINESTRAQLDAISTALAELQAKPADVKPRKPIGFIQPKDDEEEK
jgi:predicted AAA+ superfamily ATPase